MPDNYMLLAQQQQKQVGVNIPNWRTYFPETPEGQFPARKDIILTRLVERGAPAETIAEFMIRNPESYQAVGMQPFVEGVREALEKDKATIIIPEPTTGEPRKTYTIETITKRDINTIEQDKPVILPDTTPDVEQPTIEPQVYEQPVTTLPTYQLELLAQQLYQREEQEVLGIQSQQRAIAKLDNYKVGDNYDIGKYLRANPDDTQTLVTAGFDSTDIEKAKSVNREYYGTNLDDFVDKHTYVRNYFDKNNWEYNVERLDVTDIIGLTDELERRFPKAKDLEHVTPYSMAVIIRHDRVREAEEAWRQDHPAPAVDAYQYTEMYFADRGWDYKPQTLAETREERRAEGDLFVKRLAEAREDYTRKYGTSALVSTIAGDFIGSTIFVPAKAIKPNITIHDVTGLEWGIGTAQIALITLPVSSQALRLIGPVAPKVGQTVITSGSAGLFTHNTIREWNSMPLADKIVASIIDTVLIAASIGSTVGLVKARGVEFSSEKGASFSITGNKNVSNAIGDMGRAIRIGDTVLLRQAAERLRIAAADVPKELGGDYLQRKARLIEANADDWINVSQKKPPPDTEPQIKSGIEANRQHLDLLRKKLKDIRQPVRQQTLQDAIRQTQKALDEQKKVATKIKEKPVIVKFAEPGKYPPAVRKSTALTELKKSRESVRVGDKSIPVREVFTKSLQKTRSQYGISNRQLVDAYLGLPVTTQLVIMRANPDLIRQLDIEPFTRIQPEPDTQPQPAPYPLRQQQVVPAIEVQPMIQPKPQPMPQPEPQPMPVTQPVTETITETVTEPMPMPMTEIAPAFQVEQELSRTRPKPPFESEIDEIAYGTQHRGIIAWKQGFVYWVVREPYSSKKDVSVYHEDNLPDYIDPVEGGQDAAMRSLQTITGKPPGQLTIDLGIQDIIIEGDRDIRYIPDTNESTIMDIDVEGVTQQKHKRYRVSLKDDFDAYQDPEVFGSVTRI